MKRKNETHLDFETRSAVDLLKTTTEVYAKAESTHVWCAAFAKGDDEVSLTESFKVKKATPLEELVYNVKHNNIIVAHNAQFEWTIWNCILVPKYKFPYMDLEQLRCTMAMAYAMSLPGSLEKATAACGIADAKDMKGSRLMKQMAKPRKINDDGTFLWWDDDDRKKRLFNYCVQDVVGERELDNRLRFLSEEEQKLWVLDQKINAKGIHVDIKSVNYADKAVDIIKLKYNEHMANITENYVSACTNVQSIREYLRFNGVETKGVAKADIKNLLDTDINDHLRDVLETRCEASKSSNSKLKTIQTSLSADNRIRNLFQYHGAATGRWAGRKIQPHNLPRPGVSQKMIESILDNIINNPDALSLIHDKPLDLISYCIRGLLTAADGMKLVCLDFKSIEAVVLAWVAGEQKILDAFESGLCLYRIAAAGIYGTTYDNIGKSSSERQVGKVSELALGYQGGIGAFQQMAKGYNVKITDKKADEIKNAWRANRPKTKRFWNIIENAAIRAVLNPGNVIGAGKYIRFIKKGSFLYCKLPSGRLMSYPYPKVENKKTPWGESKPALFYKTVANYKWQYTDTYGGKLTENVVQAISRDLLAHSMLNVDAAGYEMVMHVHDEIVCEVDAKLDCYDIIEKIFLKKPAWAKDLPLKADGWEGKRYRK